MKKQLPKGVLLPIGGGEDKEHTESVLLRIIKETGKRKPKICIVTVASEKPKETAGDYRRAFRKLKLTTIFFIHFNTRSAADKKKDLANVKSCDAVLFSGGDQLRLSSLMGGTELLELIKQRYSEEKNFVVAGTSAGAAAMSDTMIVSGSSRDALIKGELELTNGLDLINSVFIDTHFTERGRIGRVIQTLAYNPGVLGIGLGEDTAVVIKGEKLEVIGSGLVIIADGKQIVYTDLAEIQNDEPITVEGIKIHVLGPGKKFSLKDRKLMNR
jgi:cyanophycinase